MANKFKINLDINKESYLILRCKQNDDLVLEVNLYQHGEKLDISNKTINIKGLKSNNTYIIQSDNISKSDNKITVSLNRDFTRIAGKTKIEITLQENGKQNTTFTFYLDVAKSVIDGAVESSNAVTILEKLDNKIVEAVQVKEETEQLIQSGGAATKGDIQQVNLQLEQNKYEVNVLIPKVNSLASGSPKGIFATLTELQESSNANTTDGKKNIYVVSEDGGWYYWNGTIWNKGGIYQGTAIPNKAIKFENLDDGVITKPIPKINFLKRGFFDDIKIGNNTLINTYEISDFSNHFVKKVFNGDLINNTFRIEGKFSDLGLVQGDVITVALWVFSLEKDRIILNFNQQVGSTTSYTYGNSWTTTPKLLFYTTTVNDGNLFNIQVTGRASAVSNNVVFGGLQLYKGSIIYPMTIHPTEIAEDLGSIGIRYLNQNELSNFVESKISVQDVKNPCDYKGNEVSVFKKCLCIGDSLTYGVFNYVGASKGIVEYGYPVMFTKLTGIPCTNVGLASHDSKQWYDVNKNKDFSGHDFAIIQLGVNDVGHTTTNVDGGITDFRTETIIYLAQIIDMIKLQNKNIKIFVSTILPAYVSDDYNEMSEIIRSFVADRTDCYLLDVARYSRTVEGSVYERGHLTALGYSKLAEEYKGYIGYIIANNSEDFKYVHFIGTDYVY